MASVLEVRTDRLLMKKTSYVAVDGGDRKGETESEIIAAQRSGITDQMSCDKNVTNRNRR